MELIATLDGERIDPADAELARLNRAVLISLFTWRRAAPDDDVTHRQGWWGDSFADVFDQGNDQIGSRLWLLLRAKLTQQTLLDAKKYIVEALHWLIDDGHAQRVDVSIERMGTDGLAARIAIIRGDGSQLELQIDDFWKQLNAF